MSVTVVVLGVVLILVGVASGTGSFATSRSDWAWSHRHASWRTGVNVSENRWTQTRVWQAASVILGLVFVVLSVLVIAHP